MTDVTPDYAAGVRATRAQLVARVRAWSLHFRFIASHSSRSWIAADRIAADLERCSDREIVEYGPRLSAIVDAWLEEAEGVRT